MSRVKVRRPDGKMIQVAPRRGHLFVCALGCCCGQTEEGFAPVPRDLYHAEWERRRLRNSVHLTLTACLGQCALANVVLLMLDGHTTWFHSIESEAQVLALFEYIDAIFVAERLLPVPPLLRENAFDGFASSSNGTRSFPVLSR
jgi:cobaltochelatase CobN